MATTQTSTARRLRDRSRDADRWARPAAVSAGIVAVTSIGIMALAGEVIPPLVVIAVAFGLGAAAIVRTEARWLRYGLATVGVLAIVGNLPFVVADLTHPESFAGFAPQVVLTVAVLFTAFAAVASARSLAVPVRPIGASVLALAAVAVVASASDAVAMADDEAQPGDVAVVAEDLEFPAEVRVEAGAVGFFVDNADPFRHTFLIEGTDVDQELPGSTARRVTADLEPGTYRYYCDVPGHEDMEGTLVVE